VGGQEFHFIVDGNSTLAPGDRISVGFDPAQASIFDLDNEQRL
jgi:multiple sugar transport system ATP-binding protein